jgi:glycosyltransferase involved in cell wall biosynthesis
VEEDHPLVPTELTPMNPTVTVAICTWNRAGLLDQTLTQMRGLRIPAGVTWELLVVNNNCTDDTDAILAKHAPHLPLRRLLETKQGHSHARNCAVAAAVGDLLIWTDDDVLVGPDWLAEYVVAARTWEGAAFFGGPIRPWFGSPPSAWIRRLVERVSIAWALVDHGPAVRTLQPDERIYGANLAFRLPVLKRHPFDPNLGRKGTALYGGDEETVLAAIMQEGGYGVWVGTAPVEHYLPTERLTRSYLWRFFRCGGELGYGPLMGMGKTLFGIPRWMLREYLASRLTEFFFYPFDEMRWLRAFINSARWRGRIDGYLLRRHTAVEKV